MKRTLEAALSRNFAAEETLRNEFANAAETPDVPIVGRLGGARPLFLALAGVAASASVLIAAIPFLRALVAAWIPMSFNGAIAALACTVALTISAAGENRPGRMLRLALVSAALASVAAASGASLLAMHPSVKALLIPESYPAPPGTMDFPTAFGFAILALLIPLLRARQRIFSTAADVLVAGAAFNSLTIAGRFFFAACHIFGLGSERQSPAATILVLCLLTAVASVQRARFGVFRIFFAGGIAGQIARALLPCLLVLPFLREAGRARLLFAFHFPESSAAAALGSMAAGLTVLMLVFVCRTIAAMEARINVLSLRDELTGLLNLRGFRLMGDQAIRMAQRSRVPFSVLFIDLDHLKQVNDGLGHDVGSTFLVDTATLLKSSFREVDVIGRIGGDEFAVAGQFSAEEIAAAAQRLENVAPSIPGEGRVRMPISLSVGYATGQAGAVTEIEGLLQSAELVMYGSKRTRKQKDYGAVGSER